MSAGDAYIDALGRSARAATRGAPASVRARLDSQWARGTGERRRSFERRWRATATWMWTKEGAARETRDALLAELEEHAGEWFARDDEAWRRTVFLAGAAGPPVAQAGGTGRAVREAWVRGLGGEAVLERTLARFAEHKGQAPSAVSAGRIETLAAMDEGAWRALERGPAWARGAAVRGLAPRTIAKGPRAWMGALARAALRQLVGRERCASAPGDQQVAQALAHWRWTQVRPPLGVVALCARHKPMRTESAWGGAVRLEASPATVREWIAHCGRAGASAEIRGAVEREGRHIEGEVRALAARWHAHGAAKPERAGAVHARLVAHAEGDHMVWEIPIDGGPARDAALALAAARGTRWPGEDAAMTIRIRADGSEAAKLAEGEAQ